jgi:hypothetical protein
MPAPHARRTMIAAALHAERGDGQRKLLGRLVEGLAARLAAVDG